MLTGPNYVPQKQTLHKSDHPKKIADKGKSAERKRKARKMPAGEHFKQRSK